MDVSDGLHDLFATSTFQQEPAGTGTQGGECVLVDVEGDRCRTAPPMKPGGPTSNEMGLLVD